MSLRLEMLKAASRARVILDESAELVFKFLLSQQNPDGGFGNRAGQSDLYYLPFALGALAVVSDAGSTPRESTPALQQCLLSAGRYLTRLGEGEDLDFVHLCSLARSWAAIGEGIPAGTLQRDGERQRAWSTSIARRLELHRTPDGGYHPVLGSNSGSAYGAFLALGAYQDLQAEIPNPSGLGESLQALQTSEGGYTNERYGPGPGALPAAEANLASTNASAAAIAVLSELGVSGGGKAAKWFLARLHPGGGFLASPTAPAPDLLSTATALHALALLKAPLKPIQEGALDYVDSLWTNKGGFYGHWGDDHLDCEYTFYGLLALGHLQEGSRNELG